MNIRATTIETGKRAKPLRVCIDCGCGIRGPRRCGPCADIKRETDTKRRRAAQKLMRQAEQQTTT